MRNQRGFIFGLQGLALYLVVGLAAALALSWAGSGVAIWYLDGKVTAAQESATKAAVALGKETTSRQGFEAAAAACTAGVDAIQAEADRRVAFHVKQAAVSAAATGKAQDTINGILSRQRPPGLDECAAMKRELDDEIDRRNPRP